MIALLVSRLLPLFSKRTLADNRIVSSGCVAYGQADLKRVRHAPVFSLLEALVPPALEPAWALTLVAVSAATSFVTAAAGIGGGIILLAVMAVIMPGAAIIPVHGVVQLGSNAGRAAIMLSHVQWTVFGPFVAGSLVGAFVGGLTVVQLPTQSLKLALGLFILYTVWGPPLGLGGRLVSVFTGIISSFLTMFVGATGSFIASMVKTFKFGRVEHVATHAVCMVAQHAVKVVVFGLLGFQFAPYAGLIVAMIASGFLGTTLGKRYLLKTDDRKFHRVLSAILVVLAVKLIYDGASGL